MHQALLPHLRPDEPWGAQDCSSDVAVRLAVSETRVCKRTQILQRLESIAHPLGPRAIAQPACTDVALTPGFTIQIAEFHVHVSLYCVLDFYEEYTHLLVHFRELQVPRQRAVAPATATATATPLLPRPLLPRPVLPRPLRHSPALRQLLHGHCAMRSGFTCARTRTATYLRTDNAGNNGPRVRT